MKCHNCHTKMDQEGAGWKCPSCGTKKGQPYKKRRSKKRR